MIGIKKSLGGIFFTTSKVIKSKMAAVKFMTCTLCHIFATSYDINMSEESFFLYILIHEESVFAKNGGGSHTIL